MDKITIEKARPADIEPVKMLETEYGLSNWSKDDLLREIAVNGDLFLVVKKDGELIGFMLARLITIKTESLTEIEAEIYNIVVERKYRREKIGSRLLDRLFETGRNMIKKVHLEVRESNFAALNFYTKNSFEIVGKRNNFYTNPSENAILMCRESSKEKICNLK